MIIRFGRNILRLKKNEIKKISKPGKSNGKELAGERRVLPVFRKDLLIAPRIVEGEGFRYLIKDPKSEEIYEFSEKEYFFCRRMDGSTAFDDIRISFQDHFGLRLSLEQLEAFARKLEALSLLESTKTAFDDTQPLASSERMIPLGDPDRLLGWIAIGLSWCFSRYFLIAMLVFSALGLGVFLKYANDFVDQLRWLRFYWGPVTFLLIPALAFFVIEPLGQIAKGVACRHYGGHVYELGVFLKFNIIPRFYIDLSDALWRLRKSDCLKIYSAGLICRLFLWALSLIAWRHASGWTGLEIFWVLFVFGSIFSFILTVIPLSETDGYQLLSIWQEVDNLKNRATSLAKAWFFRKPLPEPLSPREIKGFKWYGVLWAGFQFLFWGLFLGFVGYFLMTSLKGLGAIIFMGLLTFRFGHFLKPPLMRISDVTEKLMNHSPAFIRLRLLVRFGLLIVVIIVALFPYPFMVGGDFRVLPVNQVGIRSQVTSEIETVFVSEGQWVEKGTPLVKLTGRDQRRKVESTQAALDETRARLELLIKGPKPEAIASAEQEVKTAAKSLKYSTLQAERYAKLVKDNAASVQSYENALKIRDLDRERLELAKRNLELVKSGAREEEIEALEAKVRRLQVELAHALEELNDTVLTSPIDGRIITPNLSHKVGQTLMEGDLVAVVEDAHKIIAEILVPEEDVGEVLIGSTVTLKAWGYPTEAFKGKVVAIAPVAYEKSSERVERTLSEREWIYGRIQNIKQEGQVVRVLSEFSNSDAFLKTDMTGYAKIDCETKPVIVAFTRWLVRFIMVEVWSWIP
jgi:multidrug resistance efflux pump